jgi:hypothetical protein
MRVGEDGLPVASPWIVKEAGTPRLMGACWQAGSKVFEGQLKTLAKRDLWLPTEKGSCLRNVGAALHRIVNGQRFVANLAARASDG